MIQRRLPRAGVLTLAAAALLAGPAGAVDFYVNGTKVSGPEEARLGYTPTTYPAGHIWHVPPPGWNWPNLNWPSREYYFSYGVWPTTGRVFFPADPPEGESYYVTPVGRRAYVRAAPLAPDRDYASLVLEMKTPYDAEVWVEGRKTISRGTTRRLVSPPLPPGVNYRYEVRARWIENDREITQTRNVVAQAGDRVTLDFMTPIKPAPAPPPKPKPKP